MLRGRVGGRVGYRNTSQPSTSSANGLWGLQEAYDALLQNSWPVSWSAGFGVTQPASKNASCALETSFSAGGARSGAWADPIAFEWQKSLSNSNMPNTGNPWLAEWFSHNWVYFVNNESYHPLNPTSVYANGVGPAPQVKVLFDSPSSENVYFPLVTLFANFNNGAFDGSNSRRTFRIRRGGGLTTLRYRNGTRSFTGGSISYYGNSVLSGDFCIEGWFWFNDSVEKRPLFSLGTVSASGNFVQLSLNANYIELQRFGQQPIVMTSNVIDTQEWAHIALCRSGSTVRLYVNGIETGSTTDSAPFGDSLLPGNIQVYANGPQKSWEPWAADFIDEFQITNTWSRYTTNFSPPAGSLGPSQTVRPKIVVSGAGSPIANDTFYPRATGTAEWDSKQFFANDSGTCCIFWESSRGFWVISRGSGSGPAGVPREGYDGNWLYASDGNCWSPVSSSAKSYSPTTQTLSLAGLGFIDNETYYRLRATSGFLDTKSRAASLTVEPIGVSFTQEPTDQFASLGSATFSAAVSGTGQLSGDAYTGFSYQWQKRSPGSTGSFTDIEGATSSTLLVAGQSTGDNGSQFRLRATLSCGQSTTVFSRAAILYVGSPGFPLNVVGEAGNSQVVLTWSSPASQGNSPITDYVVQYSSDGGANWFTFSDGVSNSTSATVTGLANGTGYIFRVAAVNSVGSGPFSTPTVRIVPAPAGTDPYFNYVSFVSNFDGDNNSTVFEDQSLAARTVSRYGDAKISTTISKWGSSAYFDGNGDYLSISDSSAFKIGNQDFTVEAWIYPTAVGSGQYRVFATTADPIDKTGFWLGLHSDGRVNWLLGTSGSWATDRAAFSLSANQWYHVAICRSGGIARLYVNGAMRDSAASATNVANDNSLFRIGGRTIGSQYFQGYIGGLRFTKGIDRYPLGASFTSPTAPFPTSVVGATSPDAPSGVSVIAGTRQAVVSWTAPNNNGSGIRDYLVQFSSDGGTTWNNFSDGTSKSTTATVAELSDNTSYVFRVAAVNYIGTGPYSVASSAVTTNAVPDSPTGVSGTPGNGEVSVSWTSPTSNGGAAISDYTIQYSSDSGSTWTTFSDGTSTNTSATVTGLTNGTAYIFRVAAVNAVGTGAYSTASSSVSPTGTVPNSPTALSATAGDQQVSLQWASPANNGGSTITDYTIEIAPVGGSPTTLSTGNGVTSYVVTGLTNGMSYRFRVAATNSMGTGAYSTQTSPITPMAFTPIAVILTSGTSYTVPAGATTMKAWAVCGGDTNSAGGVSYKTWSSSGGTTISYSLGGWAPEELMTYDCTATYDGTTITAKTSSPFFSGGDGGSAGGETTYGGPETNYAAYGGAIGGNSATRTSCGRMPATDVSGLLAAVALAGGKVAEDCGVSAAFGSGGYYDYYDDRTVNPAKSPGFGGSTGFLETPGGPALVLYFT